MVIEDGNDIQTVVPMQLLDVETVVRIHRVAFPGFFLTFMGPGFLRELYTSIIIDASGISFVIRHSGEITGFVAGTDQPADFYRRLLQKRLFQFGFASIKPLIKRPTIMPRLLRAFAKPNDAASADNRGTLMSIGALPEYQGMGIGKALVDAFLGEAKKRQLKQVDLTTDRDDNDATNRFYQKLGFRCERDFVTPEGRWMNEYVIDL